MERKFLSLLFHKADARESKKENDITLTLLPSVLGILLCAVFLSSTTFAWFSATQTAKAPVIQTASYGVTAVLEKEGEALVKVDEAYALEADHTYTVTLTATGDANTGYCILTFDDTQVHTQQIAQGTEITFTLAISRSVTLKISPQWGTSVKTEKIASGDTYSW